MPAKKEKKPVEPVKVKSKKEKVEPVKEEKPKKEKKVKEEKPKKEKKVKEEKPKKEKKVKEVNLEYTEAEDEFDSDDYDSDELMLKAKEFQDYIISKGLDPDSLSDRELDRLCGEKNDLYLEKMQLNILRDEKENEKVAKPVVKTVKPVVKTVKPVVKTVKPVVPRKTIVKTAVKTTTKPKPIQPRVRRTIH